MKQNGYQAGAMGAVVALALTGISLTGWAQGWQLATNLSLKADLALKEAFDSNVYLQDVTPANPNAAQPFQESMVTTLTPRLALDWKPMTEFNLAVSYAPEFAWYHAEPGENYVAHRGALTFSGKVGIVQWEQFNTVNYIDGSHEGLTFGGPGGPPAIGGVPIRDRRDALIYRNGFRAYHPHGNWFFRPVAWSYIHDFRTDQRNPATYPGYQNYLDRNDLSAGIDIGYKALPQAYVLVGYRYGFQNETPVSWSPTHFSNRYHRFVLGLEGKLTEWLKVTGVVGPDYRSFHNNHTSQGFDDYHTTLYYDASIGLLPTKADTVTFLFRQYEQPAFGAASVYEDITWEVSWRHQFEGGLAVSTGMRAYIGDWLAPVSREDWIYTPSATISYVRDRHLSGDLTYSYDSAESKVMNSVLNTSGREFRRHLVSLAVKYAF
jgi:hypothetical protein